MMTDQEIVDTIRNDPKVGKGSCSVFDECYTDEEIVEYFSIYGHLNTKIVLDLAYHVEDVHISRKY